jgi:hypothetical protein
VLWFEGQTSIKLAVWTHGVTVISFRRASLLSLSSAAFLSSPSLPWRPGLPNTSAFSHPPTPLQRRRRTHTARQTGCTIYYTPRAIVRSAVSQLCTNQGLVVELAFDWTTGRSWSQLLLRNWRRCSQDIDIQVVHTVLVLVVAQVSLTQCSKSLFQGSWRSIWVSSVDISHS